VQRLLPAGQPDADPADDPDDRGHGEPTAYAGQQDQEAEDQERHRVREQVVPARVQQRREHDPVEALEVPRSHACGVELGVEDHVGELHDVQQCYEDGDDLGGDEPARASPLGLLTRPGHASTVATALKPQVSPPMSNS
jgi:hypothetical protein